MHKFNIKNIEKLDNPERRRIMPPEETLKKFNIKDDGVLLDVGCGIGYFTIPAAKILENNKVIGIDIMPEILEIAKEKAEGRRNVEFKESKEYSFPIEDNSVKYVLIGNVIHEVEDKIKYFKEVKRVLKKDGYLLIIDWDKKEMKMGPPVHERISKEEMTELCRQVGFKETENIDISSTHYGIKATFS
ncbi:class I SAM-dependent methyltransferase [Candidatus Clostridium stratigraminis]|uniref:Class I SAM-dependent methyltransferase n=1 Tax=Candidatus Clostridium stratigraminis TaxID=3381661 RepID=A0ABW8T594_9CLOT